MAEKWKLIRNFFKQEVAFNTDPDATGAAYKFARIVEATFQPTVEIVERPGENGDLTRQPHVPGVFRGTWAGKFELKGSGTPAGSAVASVASELSEVLEAYMGTVVRQMGTTIAPAGGAGKTAPIKVTSAAGLSKYGAVCIGGEIALITAIAGTDVTLDHDLAGGVPANATVVYASSIFKRANTGHKSLACVANRDGIEYTFTGGRVTACSFEGINAKGIAYANVSIEFAGRARTAKGALPAADPVPAISAVKPPVVKASPFFIDGAMTKVVGVDFNPGMSFVFQETTENAAAAAGIEAVDAAPAGAFRSYYRAQNTIDLEAATERAISFGAGDQTNGFAFYAPKVQFGQPAFQNRNGITGEDVPFMINDAGADPELTICLF